jgi:hypothetical protein
MSATNLELVTFALLKCNVIDENSAPSPEQGATALITLNDLMANMAYAGINVGWYPQVSLAAFSPLQNQDVGPVKLLLTASLAAHYGIPLGELLMAEIEGAGLRLAKTALQYGEADLSELPRTQGIYNGGWY